MIKVCLLTQHCKVGLLLVKAMMTDRLAGSLAIKYIPIKTDQFIIIKLFSV